MSHRTTAWGFLALALIAYGFAGIPIGEMLYHMPITYTITEYRLLAIRDLMWALLAILIAIFFVLLDIGDRLKG